MCDTKKCCLAVLSSCAVLMSVTYGQDLPETSILLPNTSPRNVMGIFIKGC